LIVLNEMNELSMKAALLMKFVASITGSVAGGQIS